MNIVQIIYQYVFEPLLSSPTFDLNPMYLALKMIRWFRGEPDAAPTE